MYDSTGIITIPGIVVDRDLLDSMGSANAYRGLDVDDIRIAGKVCPLGGFSMARIVFSYQRFYQR